MKYIALLGLLAMPYGLYASIANIPDFFQNYTSQTFMMPRPAYHNTPTILGRWGTILAKLSGENQTAGHITPLHQWSRTWDRSAPYFLLNCKNQLVVAGDHSTIAPADRDVRAEWLGLADNVTGTFTCQPKQEIWGAIISFSQGFGKWTNWKIIKDWWFEAAIPVLSVKNQLQPQSSDPQITDVLASLRFNAARWDKQAERKTGVACIRAILGATIIDDEKFVLIYHGGIEIPTESRVRPDQLFSPMLGSNGHVSILNGVFGRLHLHTFPNTCCAAQFFASFEHHYYLERDQTRVFDLFGKPWSRYLPVRRAGEEQTIPATQILTRRVTIRPGGFADLSAGFALTHQKGEFEIGYALWAHHHERINWPEKPYCDKGRDPLSYYAIAGEQLGSSASTSTIAIRGEDDAVFTPIKASNIDLFSGISRGSLVNRIFVNGSYKSHYKNGTMFLGLGGSIDFPRENSALRTAQVWLNLGMQI